MDSNKIIKEILPYVFIVVIVVFIRTFIITPVRVDGSSMDPTLRNNQILLLSKISKKYDRFDIVVIKKNNIKLVKRVIGLPGETVEYKNNKLYINNKKTKDAVSIKIDDFKYTIPNNYYFVMGDNRNNSADSRDYRIGLIKKDEIKGITVFRLWPFTKFGVL